MNRILRTAGVAVLGIVAIAAVPMSARAEHNDQLNVFFSIAGNGFQAAFANYSPTAPPRCEPPRRWIPGHYECRRDRVCIPGYWQTVQVPAEYGWVRHGWRRCYVVVKPPCTQRVWVPERYEWKEAKVWVPGHFERADGYARAY